MPHANTLFSLLVAAGALASSLQSPAPAAPQAATSPRPATPIEPASAIVDAFRLHPLVAIGDNHGSNEGHAARLAIIGDPRLEGVLNDIVVEFGNSRYQPLIDRFISGATVAEAELRHVWQDTTQVEETWDLPIYEEFFRTVRAINASRPARHQLRVLLGDPPIDWSQVQSGEDLKKLPDRDEYAAAVVQTEVLAKRRRALIIYGDEHLLRKNTIVGAADEWARGVVARLEMTKAASVFNVHTESRADLAGLQPDIASWPRPSLAIVASTLLGQQTYNPAPKARPVKLEDQLSSPKVRRSGSSACRPTAQSPP